MNRHRYGSERGAILVNTALALVIVFGVSTYVVDFGALWISRHQAQNAADAGALGGAIARAYEDFDDPPLSTGAAVASAKHVAGANPVWGAGDPTTTAVASFPCPPDAVSPFRCVRVDVYRNGENGSTPLPTWFAKTMGITSQGVRATASAQVLNVFSTICLRPWAIPDTWIETDPGGTHFDLLRGDTYIPPTPLGPGTGVRFPTANGVMSDLGAPRALVPMPIADVLNDTVLMTNGSVVPLQLPGGDVTVCNGAPVTIGDQIPVTATGPFASDFSQLYDLDSSATWDVAARAIQDSCAPGCAPISPRVVPIVILDTLIFEWRRYKADWTACPPGRTCTPCPGPCVTVANIVGLFIADSTGSTGYLTAYPGMPPADLSAPPKLSPQSAFLKAISLVR